jgi:anti-sigma-K factor RskA
MRCARSARSSSKVTSLTDRDDSVHSDVASYAIGALDGDDRVRFEDHLAQCETCQAELEKLTEVAVLLRSSEPLPDPPLDLRARTLAAVAAAGEADAAAAAGHPINETPVTDLGERRRRVSARGARAAAIATAATVAAFTVGTQIDRARDPRVEPAGGSGTPELTATLGASDGKGRALARISKLGIGRVISLSTDDLPVLDNDKEFYELWFVAADDTRDRPNRVSAGTFHPDDDGEVSVSLTAAVVPADYPQIEVTREPRNGDPRPTGRPVLSRTQ